MLPRRQKVDSLQEHPFKTFFILLLSPLLAAITVVLIVVSFSCLYVHRLYEKASGCTCSGSWFWANPTQSRFSKACPYHYGKLQVKEEFKLALLKGSDPRALLTSNDQYMRKYAKRYLRK